MRRWGPHERYHPDRSYLHPPERLGGDMAVRLRDGELVTTLIAVALSLALVFRVWADVRPMLDRLVTVHESRYAKPAASTSEPMPDDLYAQAKTLAGEWAQDDLMASMQEAYAELGDWTKVRARFVGVMG